VRFTTSAETSTLPAHTHDTRACLSFTPHSGSAGVRGSNNGPATDSRPPDPGASGTHTDNATPRWFCLPPDAVATRRIVSHNSGEPRVIRTPLDLSHYLPPFKTPMRQGQTRQAFRRSAPPHQPFPGAPFAGSGRLGRRVGRGS